MENHQASLHDKAIPFPLPISPNSSSSSSSSSSSGSSSSSNNNNGGGAAAAFVALSPQPPTPKSISRSVDANNPYPTTFIQADSSSFKQVVQMLTGSPETAAKRTASASAPSPPPTTKNALPPAAKATGPKKPAFKLYERRIGLKNLKMISPLMSPPPMGSAGPSPRKLPPEILSPSVLDFPSLALSPVTPLIPDPFNRSPPQANPAAMTAMSAEDRAIAEKGFYLHPSPRTTPRGSEPPRLLPLFPETSPRMSPASAAGTST